MKLVTAVFLACAGPVLAQDADEGAELFQFHCATCHGVTAQGDGPMANALIIRPPDLTRLAARNAGVFPVIRVVMRIDGRDPLVSHGSDMPVYGPFFGPDETFVRAETGQPMLTSQPAADLLAWLEGVQEE